MTIIHDYIKYTKDYQEKYGDKCLILMQVGGFYEVYSTSDDTSGFIYKISDICNIQIAKKNKAILEVSVSNPLMVGFPIISIRKFTNILLNNNYTIVLIEQVVEPPSTEIVRKVTDILSPGMNINVENKKNNFMTVLYYEYIEELPIVGISGIDLSTGKSFIYEAYSTLSDPEFTNDEVFRIMTTYNPREVIILSDKPYDKSKKSYLMKNLNLSNILTHYKWDTYEYISQMTKITYQNIILEKAFKKKNMLSICESINLERYHFARISLCCLLQFAYEHNADIINQMNDPEILNDCSILNIEYNSAVQLNILRMYPNDKPLIDILNRCNTSFGARTFDDRILNPIIDKKVLNKRYDDIEYLMKENRFQQVSKHLGNILDLERLKRKMLISKMHPLDWYGFHNSIENCILILDKYYEHESTAEYKDMIDYYMNILDISETCKYSLSDIKGNIFIKGLYSEIDGLVTEFKSAYSVISNINKRINNISDNDATSCKIDYADRYGHYINMTKKRFDTARKQEPVFMKEFSSTATGQSNVRLYNNNITNASQKMETIQIDIKNTVTRYYQKFVSTFVEKYGKIIDNLRIIITDIDISCCNARNAYQYRYYRPKIIDKDESFVKAKTLRHPIVERINDEVEYIGNDIELSIENQNGMLLYGINSAGKSTLMKSIGISIIMAQCGMFVASEQMEYSPYKHIFTRISGMDNIYKGMSSFIVEMTELRNILQRCNKNSLVLGDEVCSGTEAVSALAIVAAGIETLVKKNTSFVFATHLHDLVDIKVVKKYTKSYINVYHIHISIDDNNRIIYYRKLKEGRGIDTYGIEVCKSLDMPSEFMMTAETIRKEICGYSHLISNPLCSKYNNDVYMTECAICKKPAEDTHHINYQSKSDDNGFFTNFHKNIKHNLIPLCKECHNDEHRGLIKINGYKSTSDGRVVDYIVINDDTNIEKVQKHNEDERTKMSKDTEVTEDEYNNIKQFVKRGKCGWYLRNIRTKIFKECKDKQKIREKINTILKRTVIYSDDNLSDTELSNNLYDPMM